MQRRHFAPLLLGSVALASALGLSSAHAQAPTAAPASGTTPAAAPRVTLNTNLGAIVLELDPVRAPLTENTFCKTCATATTTAPCFTASSPAS